ncbi:MAG: response regulator [Terriglobia bacterium]
MPILAIVEDLIFLSKIQQTASLTNTRVEVIQPRELAERLSRGAPSAVICDLNYRAGLGLETVRAMKANPAFLAVPVIGFLSHVQADLAKQAREAGCDVVMARSAFASQLPRILREYATMDAAPSSASSNAQ